MYMYAFKKVDVHVGCGWMAFQSTSQLFFYFHNHILKLLYLVA